MPSWATSFTGLQASKIRLNRSRVGGTAKHDTEYRLLSNRSGRNTHASATSGGACQGQSGEEALEVAAARGYSMFNAAGTGASAVERPAV